MYAYIGNKMCCANTIVVKRGDKKNYFRGK